MLNKNDWSFKVTSECFCLFLVCYKENIIILSHVLLLSLDASVLWAIQELDVHSLTPVGLVHVCKGVPA